MSCSSATITTIIWICRRCAGLAHRGQSQFVVPAGVARLLRSQNIGPVHELDWGESLPLAEATIHCVPALHFSARGIFDRNRTLWCGYVIEAAKRIVYFAGDTAFGDHFAQIRERFGAPRLALLPIGAYEPRWFMSPVHMGPDEAVERMKSWAPRPASRSITALFNWPMRVSTRPESSSERVRAGRFVSGAQTMANP